MVPGAKLNGNLLNFVDQTVLFLFERRKDSTNFPIHCFSMIDILAGDMLFFLNTRFKDLNQKAILNAEFKQMKNEITSLTKNSKKDYYDKYFTKHKDNLGKTWQGIKEIINIKAKNSDYPSCIIVDGKTITDPTEIASQSNTFYVSIKCCP